MSRKFVISYADNSIDIIEVLDGSTNEEIIAKSPRYQANTGYRDIVEDDIPSAYMMFRDAWEDSQSGEQIDVNCEKARNWALSVLRQKRDEELERLDGLKMRADEMSLLTQAISILSDKTTLRDCTDTLKNMDASGYNDGVKLAQIIAEKDLPTINN